MERVLRLNYIYFFHIPILKGNFKQTKLVKVLLKDLYFQTPSLLNHFLTQSHLISTFPYTITSHVPSKLLLQQRKSAKRMKVFSANL